MSRYEVSLPKQPYIPWILWLALIMWMYGSLATKDNQNIVSATLIILGLLWIAMLVTVAIERITSIVGLHVRLLSIIICISIAGIRCYAYTQWYETSCDMLFTIPISSFIWIVDGDAFVTTSGTYNVEAIGQSENADQIRVMLETEDEPIRGQRLQGVGKAKMLSSSAYDVRLGQRGICAKVKLTHIQAIQSSDSLFAPILAFRERILQSIDYTRSFGRSLIAALLCNMKQGLNQRQARELFAHAGISHLVAVSGTHLSLIAVAVSSLFKRLHISTYLSRIIALGLVVLFVVLCGFPPSAIRAALMTGIVVLAQNAKRRSNVLVSIAVSLIVMLMIQPEVSHDLGFTLSFIAVLTLSIFGPYARYLIEQAHLFSLSGLWTHRNCLKTFAQFIKGMRETIVLTILVQLTSLPFLISNNGELALVAPLSNIIFSPCIVMSMLIGFLFVASAGIPILGTVWGSIVDTFGRIFYAILQQLQSVPTLSIDGGLANSVYVALIGGILLFLLLFWPKQTKKSARLSIMGIMLAVLVPCFIH